MAIYKNELIFLFKQLITEFEQILLLEREREDRPKERRRRRNKVVKST